MMFYCSNRKLTQAGYRTSFLLPSSLLLEPSWRNLPESPGPLQQQVKHGKTLETEAVVAKHSVTTISCILEEIISYILEETAQTVGSRWLPEWMYVVDMSMSKMPASCEWQGRPLACGHTDYNFLSHMTAGWAYPIQRTLCRLAHPPPCLSCI